MREWKGFAQMEMIRTLRLFTEQQGRKEGEVGKKG